MNNNDSSSSIQNSPLVFLTILNNSDSDKISWKCSPFES